MKSKIVQLADSPAIPVPQPLLDTCHLQDEVEAEAQGGSLLIRSPKHPREGWDAAFRRMASNSDDKLLFNDSAA